MVSTRPARRRRDRRVQSPRPRCALHAQADWPLLKRSPTGPPSPSRTPRLSQALEARNADLSDGARASRRGRLGNPGRDLELTPPTSNDRFTRRSRRRTPPDYAVPCSLPARIERERSTWSASNYQPLALKRSRGSSRPGPPPSLYRPRYSRAPGRPCPDVELDRNLQGPRLFATPVGFRSVLSVTDLLKDGNTLGAITSGRRERYAPSTDRQVDSCSRPSPIRRSIAIENVRLVNRKLEARNSELRVAREQQDRQPASSQGDGPVGGHLILMPVFEDRGRETQEALRRPRGLDLPLRGQDLRGVASCYIRLS